MFKSHRAGAVAIAAILALTAVGSGPALANDPVPAAADEPMSDAEVIAAERGITVADAQRVLDQQVEFDALQDELAAAYPSFNDGWSKGRKADREYIVSFHRTAPGDVDARAATHGLVVTTRVSKRSMAELSAIVNRLATELADKGYDASIGFDMETEKVAATVKTTASAEVLRTKVTASRDSAVELETTTAAIVQEQATYAYGGAELRYDGGMYCTSGFSMKNIATGTDGVLTAGHCTGVDAYRDPATGVGFLAVMSRQYRGAKGDFGYINVQGITSRPYFYSSSSSTRGHHEHRVERQH